MLGALAGAALILTMTFEQVRPWIWFAWVALPSLGVLVEFERRVVLQLVAALVDEVAHNLGLHHLLPPVAATPNTRRAVPQPRRDERDDLEELL
jgi:hypothetical protein